MNPKVLPYCHLPGSSMCTIIQLKATSAPVFPVKYTALRQASKGKPISASCITEDSSMSAAAEHSKITHREKQNFPLPAFITLRPLIYRLPEVHFIGS